MGAGDIGSIIDTLEFDTTECAKPTVVHVYGTIYAIAYYHVVGDGYVTTVDIANDGQITDTVIATFKYASTVSSQPHIVKVHANVFAIAYQVSDDDGWIKTVGIANNGQITDPVLDLLEFEDGEAMAPHMCKVATGRVAIVYEDENIDCKVCTIAIGSDGAMPATVTSSLVIFAGFCYEHSIIEVGAGRFAIIYRSNAYDLWVRTRTIAPGGLIGTEDIDSLQLTHRDFYRPKVCEVDGNKYAVVNHDAVDDGWVLTIEINSVGMIYDGWIDELEFDGFNGKYPDIVKVGPGVFAIAYEGAGTQGELDTVEILNDGQIRDTLIDSIVFDGADGLEPFPFHIYGNVFAVAYSGVNTDGFLKTMGIEAPVARRPRHNLMMGMGP